jgi:chromate reductase
MENKIIRILGISGSLRKASNNTGLLRAAMEVMPDNMEMDIFDLSAIPLYNGDLEKDPPEAVLEFKTKIAEADGLLFAVPEYNYSIAGVLKNAIDWASRPVKDSPLNDKPFALMGAGGGLGTARAQYHFRQLAVFTNMHTFNKPELFVSKAWEKFDQNGNLTDESIKEKIKSLLETFGLWIKRFQVKID